ncbi:hypothetical protein TVAG_184860 [Trichomonas vaginalis G3]|uniref:Uncharacterized protein n=1 Tax=Trichomonas vaginalis (strain ATCC PRA-98 / G3) TaxID=412133 RepID=A2D8D1_TRIV3|nr:sulfurtransferase-related family [Trichomonas vaginalis G3]EAY23180.1 hypothetical protein TVAG_184860 [Trichomonas vaginalis G3]KAI5534195.1 sulfurtransferase-related family [Trichomonas vaginalis G3]|eukprot:XP_001584166.1 hypothetical protein [Trichomonas vaginalis G3]
MINTLRKKCGMACSSFHLFDDNDKIVIPIDADKFKLTLAGWMQYKIKKTTSKPTIKYIHFYASNEPDPITKQILDEFSEQHQFSIEYVHHQDINSTKELYDMYIEQADLNNFNKIAISDTIEAINCSILSKMCDAGVFDGPDPKQEISIKNEEKLYIIRPFCYCLERDIDNYMKKNNLKSHLGGIFVTPTKSFEASRDALETLNSESTNIHINFFSSQFQVDSLYIGDGDGKAHEIDDI